MCSGCLIVMLIAEETAGSNNARASSTIPQSAELACKSSRNNRAGMEQSQQFSQQGSSARERAESYTSAIQAVTCSRDTRW